MKNWLTKLFAIGVLSAAATGCGGGASPETATSTMEFPLSSGYRLRVIAGHTDSFNISGTCSGSATITTAASSTSTFEGVPGYTSAQTVIINLLNCTPASSAVTGSNYYNANYAPIGYSIPGAEYGVYTGTPTIPTVVKVGDTGELARQTTYTSSTKTVITGSRILSYVVESDTVNTAIVNLITKSFDTNGALLYTGQSRYRISADGTLFMVSLDAQYSTTSNAHLIYTKS